MGCTFSTMLVLTDTDAVRKNKWDIFNDNVATVKKKKKLFFGSEKISWTFSMIMLQLLKSLKKVFCFCFLVQKKLSWTFLMIMLQLLRIFLFFGSAVI